jgi:AbrB family looped-hinge helix DNA binding protein
MAAYKGRIVSGGRLQIPADVRKELGLADGDAVRISIENGEVRIRPFKDVVKELQARIRKYVPEGVSITDELIADRRAEAARE